LDFLGLIVSLLIVFAIFFLAWFLTRIVASRGGFKGQGRYIEIIEKYPLGKDSSLMIVKSFEKILLVGVTMQGMTTLKEFDPSEINLDKSAPPAPQGFAEVFKSTLGSALPEGKVKKAISDLAKRMGGKRDE
jgi:flagellar biosynthetic protein FliO